MERSRLLRWLLIGAAVFVFIQFVLPMITGKKDGGSDELQSLGPDDWSMAPERKDEQFCKLQGPRFSAELSTHGASLRHVRMLDHQYTVHSKGQGDPIDLVTTTKEQRMPLRTDLRAPVPTAQQVPFHDLDWSLTAESPTSCTFTYADEGAEVVKTISTNSRPFELDVSLKVTNKAAEPRQHRLTIEQTDWRLDKEMAGSMGRTSEFMTELVLRAGKSKRLNASDFKPSAFGDKEFTTEKWYRLPGDPQWAAVSSSYFAKALVALPGPAAPAAEARAEEWWENHQAKKSDDPTYGHAFRARLAYPTQELQPGAAVEYKVLAYVGPKERALLAGIGGGDHYGTSDLLDLGMFGWIGKVLIQYLYFLQSVVGHWGWAICLLTITVRLVLFPLGISQIKSSMAMRKLKPQMDELNAKYKADPQQKSLALQELFRKNNVTNPVLGCIPVLLQMPVWFALYQALNTAVELYHIPFGPFIPDLSAAGLYYIIPILLGGSSFLQQRLMPMQGDPMQQKMMMYLMPGMFTVFMLFLPAGLGIYFLTNTWLGIGQQLAVEKYYKSRAAARAPADEAMKQPSAADETKSRLMRKDKARVQQRG